MISLRKHLDDYWKSPVPEPDVSDFSPLPGEPSLEALRTALFAFGHCGQRAVPGLDSGLETRLAEIYRGIAPSPTPDRLRDASSQVQSELDQWAERALQQHNQNEREIREIVGVVARAAETISRKDEKYSREFHELTGQVRSLADLKDVAVLRRSILDSATLLKSCVEKMAEEGKAAVVQLTAEVAEYRSRLEASERAAAIDSLTQLGNRRAFERAIEKKLASRDVFSLILIDLNEFKQINDRHGHLAGDELLRQFGSELRAQFSAADIVSRWGGDEFSVIVDGDLHAANDRARRIEKWVLGEYKLASGGQQTKVTVSACLGVVEWNQRETGAELLARADQNLYSCKAARHSTRQIRR